MGRAMVAEREQRERQRRELARRGVAVALQGSERALAATAHAAIFFGIGLLPTLIVPVVIWLVSKRSAYVREQSDRAGRYQIFVLLTNILAIALWVACLALLLWLTGWRILGFGGGDPHIARSLPITLIIVLDTLLLLVALPVFAVWYFGTLAYGIYGAVSALAGHDFRYPPPPWGRRKRRDARDDVADADDEAPDDRKLTWVE